MYLIALSDAVLSLAEAATGTGDVAMGVDVPLGGKPRSKNGPIFPPRRGLARWYLKFATQEDINSPELKRTIAEKRDKKDKIQKRGFDLDRESDKPADQVWAKEETGVKPQNRSNGDSFALQYARSIERNKYGRTDGFS